MFGVVFDSFGITVFGVFGLFCFGVIPPPFGFGSEGMLLGVTGLFGLFGMQISSFGISSIFGIIIFKRLLQFSPYSGSSNANEPVCGHPGIEFEFGFLNISDWYLPSVNSCV